MPALSKNGRSVEDEGDDGPTAQLLATQPEKAQELASLLLLQGGSSSIELRRIVRGFPQVGRATGGWDTRIRTCVAAPASRC